MGQLTRKTYTKPPPPVSPSLTEQLANQTDLHLAQDLLGAQRCAKAQAPGAKTTASYPQVTCQGCQDYYDPASLREAALKAGITLWQDNKAKIVLKVSEVGQTVSYLCFAHEKGGYCLEVQTLRKGTFEERYKPVPHYPVARACRRFVGWATKHGAAPEALDLLAKVVTVSDLDRGLAAGAVKAARIIMTPEVKERLRERAALKAEKAGKEPSKPRGETAAGLFRKLIIEGGRTDQEIFKLVQAAFGLDDKKFAYVNWYRKELINKGALRADGTQQPSK